MESNENIITIPKLDYTPDPRGAGYIFFQEMKKNRDLVAQVDGLTGEKDTFGGLLERCIRTAREMKARGVSSGDIVSLCTLNHLNSCVPFIASLFLGARVASLDPSIPVKDTTFLLNQVQPKMIFVESASVQLIEEALQELPFKSEMVVFGDSLKYSGFSEFLKPSTEESSFVPRCVTTLKETAVILFSSGTGGFPKGICINHYTILGEVNVCPYLGYNWKLMVSFASMYWMSAMMMLVNSLIHGYARLVCPKFDPVNVWNLVHEYKPTALIMAPNQAIEMFKQGRPVGVDTSSVTDLIMGGAPISKEQIDNIESVLPSTNVSLIYGQSEVAGFIATFKPSCPRDMELKKTKSGTSGLPVPGFSYKIVNPETEEILGANQRGEIRLKTDFMMNGYYNIDSSDVFDSDGYLKTGDVGYYDDDQCIYVVDRVKEMLKYKSWHIPPAIMESVLLTHPAVKTAVVIGIPHEEDGDHPMGLVVLQESAKDVTSEEIKKYVDERVSDRQKLRGGLKIIKQIPMTPTGKVKRQELRDKVLRGEI